MSVERLIELRQLVDHHNKCYYRDDFPQISDMEYDKLFRELLVLEKEHPEAFSPSSPILRIGTKPVETFSSVYHQYKMYSLNNAESQKAFFSFVDMVLNVPVASFATPSIILEYKFDGLAIELVYEDGVLVEGSTRGDGEIGELVTHNVRTIKNISLNLGSSAPNHIVVYGEAIILKDDFLELNKIREKNEKKEFANPRNAAAGSIRLLDSSLCAQRKLMFYAYDVRTKDKNHPLFSMNLHTHRMDYLKSIGFMTSPEYKIVHAGNLHESLDFYQKIYNKRSSLPFEIDGLVAKVVMDEIRDLVGYTDRAPKWAIAWKFYAEEVETTIKDLECEVGRTGSLTPVAILEPVELSGAKISRASLHNFEYIAEHDFRINDTVLIKRAGDVIPFVVCTVLKNRDLDKVKEILEPEFCPICGTATEKDKTHQNVEARILRCPNIICPSRLKARLKYFVSNQGMDIDGFGDRIVDVLFENGLLGSKDIAFVDLFASIYRLKDHADQILKIEGFAQKKVNQLIDHITKNMQPKLSDFIRALGIRSVGSVSANKLAKKFETFNNFVDAYQEGGTEYEILQQIFSIREKKSQNTQFDIANYLKEIEGSIAKSSDLTIDKPKNIHKKGDRAEEMDLIHHLSVSFSITEEIVSFFSEKRYHLELEELFQTSFSIKAEEKNNNDLVQNPFINKKILFTGKSNFLSGRKEVIEFLLSLGAESMAGVTTHVDLVVMGQKPGSEKIKKAIDLDIPMLKEEDFFEQLNPVILSDFRD